MEKGGGIYNILEKIDCIIAGRAFAAGGSVSVADLHLVNVCNMVEAPTAFDGFKPNGLDPLVNLVKLRQAVVSLPPLVAFYKDADGIRSQFKPK